MRIGMLLDKPFPPDPRVANEARSLVAAGHEITLFCLHPGGASEEIDWQGVRVVRYGIGRQFWKKASALVLTLGLYNRWFRARLPGFLRRYGIEALHVHDLPLVGEGLRASRAAGIPLVADLHENYPAAVRLYAWAQTPLGRLVVDPRRWDAYEREVVPRADRVIVVIDEARDRMPDLGVDPAKVAVIENTVAADEFESFPRDKDIIADGQAAFTVTYLGTFDRHRGLESVIDAAGLLADRIPNLRVLLVGAGATRGELEERARRQGLESRVTFAGWQPFERFPSYVLGSSVCLIPHLKSAHTDTTIPHKLFHYMLLQRPVVTTDCAPLARIVRETGCGEVYPSGDAQALAGALDGLRSATRRDELGRRGREAVLTTYNWEKTAQKLVALYASLATEANRPVRLAGDGG